MDAERVSQVDIGAEATGDFANMKLTRKLCGPDFKILSGDDDKTLDMMLDPEIKAAGVISVVSNVAPKSVRDMCQYALDNRVAEARKVAEALKPLFEIVTIKTVEETGRGQTAFKARNPLPIKTLMGILGMPGGPLRQPLGKLTTQALEALLMRARKVQAQNPEIFAPISDFFDVDVEERLTNDRYLRGWAYDGY